MSEGRRRSCRGICGSGGSKRDLPQRHSDTKDIEAKSGPTFAKSAKDGPPSRSVAGYWPELCAWSLRGHGMPCPCITELADSFVWDGGKPYWWTARRKSATRP